MARIIRTLVLGAALAGGALALASCVPDTEVSVCDPGQGGSAATGSFLGETPTAPVTTYKAKGEILSMVAIEALTVGGVPVPATAAASNFALWTVDLTRDDLEANRVDTDAKLDLVAKTVCGQSTTLASRLVPIGPSPTVPVTNLELTIEPPQGACYLPADGSAPARVHVSADKAFAFSAVTPAASKGTLSPSGNVTLNQDGAFDLFFTASAPGMAIVTVSSGGVTGDPHAILVAAEPQLAPTGGVAVRGTPYSLYVSSAGNLATCRLEASSPSKVSVTVAEPAALAGTPITAVNTPVKAATADCATPEQLRVEVLFDQSAPDGAAVTLRCRDTFGQEGMVNLPLKT
jgi:hypothetical protein